MARDTNTTLKEAVDSWANEPDNDDEILTSVSEYGAYDATPLHRREIPVPDSERDVEPREVFVTEELTEEAFTTIREFVQEYEPVAKACYANAVELCRFDDRFDYVEGVTASSGTGTVHNHAWNTFDGMPVDVTRPSPERYGVRVPNATIQDSITVFESANQWNFLTNAAIPTDSKPPYSE